MPHQKGTVRSDATKGTQSVTLQRTSTWGATVEKALF